MSPKYVPFAPPKEPRIVRFHLSGDGDTCDTCGWKMPGYYYVHARTDGHLFCSLECSNASPPLTGDQK